MTIPEINEQDIINALKYIDENGVPFHHQSTKYDLVTEDGKLKLKAFWKVRALPLKQGSRKNTNCLLRLTV